MPPTISFSDSLTSPPAVIVFTSALPSIRLPLLKSLLP